jgi:hypothetical protein
MDKRDNKEKVSYDLLKKFGAKWAVLAAMELDLASKGEFISKRTLKNLEMAHVKISSGCFSTCEASCDLGKIEGAMVAIGAQYGDNYMDKWFDLFELAMAGKLESKDIANVPVLKPIQSKCGFLECNC